MPIKLTSYYRGSVLPMLPGNDTFHSTTLFHLYEETPGCYPVLLVVSDGDKVLGKLLAVVQRIVRFLPFYAIRRCVSYGPGEFFCADHQREEVFKLLMSELTSYANRMDCFVVEVRNLPQALTGFAIFKQNNYFPVNWMRVRNSLSVEGKIEQTFSPSRRRQIRRALKNGAETMSIHTKAEITEFTEMLKRNYSYKIRKHFPNDKFFSLMKDYLVEGRLSKIFVTKLHEKIIGGCVCIYSGDTAFVWFSGGMNKTHILQSPTVMAIWTALTDAQQRGYRYLEFLDVGTPFRKHGYRDFVLRFGGEQISTRRWFHFRWKWLNQLCVSFYS